MLRQLGCPPVNLAPVANNWLHSNSVSYTADGHFLLSMRHQDWVIKINYAIGAGSGNVIWRLGKDDDFTITSSDPYPWFSHQHDADEAGRKDTHELNADLAPILLRSEPRKGWRVETTISHPGSSGLFRMDFLSRLRCVLTGS